jgi:hypothetical protein
MRLIAWPRPLLEVGETAVGAAEMEARTRSRVRRSPAPAVAIVLRVLEWLTAPGAARLHQ